MSADVNLRGEDALELAEMLEFLHDWIAGSPDAQTSFRRFSFGLFTIAEIRADLARFVFLLGGSEDRFVFGDQR